MADKTRYGPVHVKTRARLMKRYRPGVTICWRCTQPINLPPHRVHLGHDDDDPTKYRGLEHDHCNTQAGGINSGRVRRGGWDREAVCSSCHTPFTRRQESEQQCPRCRKLVRRGEPPIPASGRAW